MKTLSPEELKKKRYTYRTQYHDIHVVCNLTEFIFGFPLSTPRREAQAISLSYDPSNEEIILIGKPIQHNGYKVGYRKPIIGPAINNSNTIIKYYPMIAYGARIFRKLDENRTLYTEIFLIDTLGWSLRNYFKRDMIKKRGKFLKETIQKALSETGELYTFESRKKHLKQDAIGKLITLIDIPTIKKKYLESQRIMQ